ncbi:hypothetical protein H9L10_13490 [Phycicoccus endophyticus]|uniref:Uncharacterized protein n=1 Tax=Phycicoccus endophyticus TaxID=1690220 RepID=A0A7G9R0U6_9MICO|nr:hypothetical protein [Phycicoccus endophyticus]NHI19512.1 hypothetical protein [Phycicoccus endophyticus]QNN49221.1 hypothetical protein H9L10_13490 [Phycicoccus endophyticus]GGL39754.1 hypothetical protein GCM10012283_22830 [Phycicoccus endophyticus]
MLASVVLALLGLAGVAIGVMAWSQPRLPVSVVADGAPVTLEGSPLFDPGTTLFAAGDNPDLPEPAQWGCTRTRGGAVTELEVTPDFDAVGSRVEDSSSYFPVVTVGPSEAGDVLRCDGPAMSQGPLLALPTDVGVRDVPLAFVVAGIGLLGIGGLVHPRSRGIHRFGG